MFVWEVFLTMKLELQTLPLEDSGRGLDGAGGGGGGTGQFVRRAGTEDSGQRAAGFCLQPLQLISQALS